MHLRPHRRKSLSIILLIFVQCISLAQSSCVMYDVCHKLGSSTMNCVVDDFAPRPLSRPEDAEAQQTLKSICPHLFNGTGDNAFCCSSNQVDNMSRQLKMAANLLSPCPSCFDNFQKLWCEFTCSPKQDEFVQVEQVIEVPARNESYVDRVRYRISERFADTLYDSCKNVMMNGQPALKVMCTKLSEPHYSCPRDEWFKFMGTQDLTQGIPMNIDFVIVKEEQTTDLLMKNNYMHVNGTPCTVPPRFGMSSCPRQHCPQIPVSDFFPQDGGTKEPCNLWGIGCTVVSLVFVCFFCFVVLVCCTTANLYVKTDMNEYNSIPSPKGAFESVADWIERHMKGFFAAYGEFMAEHRLLMIVAGVMVFILTAFGLGFVRFTTDPVELWSAPHSRTRYEKKFFDDNFEPFFRVEQVIMHPKNVRSFYHKDKLIGPVFQKEFLREVFKVVHLIRSVTVTAPDGSSVNLDDICYRPLDAPHDCMINTPANYFQMNELLLDQEVAPKVAAPAADDFADYFETENEEKEEKVTYLDHLLECINNPLQLETSFGVGCLGTYGGPIGPELVFGGANETKNYIQSTGITMMFLVTGKTNVAKKAMAWEEGFIDLIKTYNSDLVQISFMAERSISDEIKRESMSDAAIIGLACVLMVLYIMFSLGTYTVDENRLLSMFVHSKILIAMAGVVTIVLSVFSSFGTYSLYGLTVPQSAVFVQFFVLLSIGTNRMFTTIYTVKKFTHSCDTLSELMYNVCGDCLPTMFICSVSESLCFFIGGLIPVPAVRSFALLAAFALLIHFVLHCTIFLPLLTLDVQRELRGTPELMCCIKIETEMPDNDGYVKMVMEKYVAPFIMKRWFRISALVIGFLILAASPFSYSYIQLGLDQKMAVPEDSYVYTHFKNMDRFLNVGPPVYFVVSGGIDLSEKTNQNKICAQGGCSPQSLGNLLNEAVSNSNITHLQGEVHNWMDQYLSWLSRSNQCCRLLKVNGTVTSQYCPSHVDDKNCVSCDRDMSDPSGRPSKRAFLPHIKQFKQDIPNKFCAFGGKGAFHKAIELGPRGQVDASHFMTYHTPMRTAAEFIAGMEGARMVARKMEHYLDGALQVFPYSTYYLFYDHYLTLRVEASYQLVASITAIFASVGVLSGLDAWNAIIVGVACFSHLIYQVVLMAIWRIEFNPITAANLIMGVGVSAEFFVPIVMTFSRSRKEDGKERAKEALVESGATIFAGIFNTLLIGTIVLSFAHSQFFQVFYSRMFLGIVLSGGFHAIVLLPALLSFCGPPVKARYCRGPDVNDQIGVESPRSEALGHGVSNRIMDCTESSKEQMNPLLSGLSSLSQSTIYDRIPQTIDE